MLRHAFLGSALGLALVCPAPARAQGRAFDALQDSLSRVESVEALRLRRARLPDVRRPADPGATVERGLITLRLYDLTDDEQELDRAQETFEDAADAFPASPWAQYGLALALMRRAERNARAGGLAGAAVLDDVFARALHRDPRTRARQALHRALEADPSFIPAASLLVRLAAEESDAGDLQAAREALWRARAAGGSSFALALSLADAEFALGNYESAATAAEAAVDAADREHGDIALALLAQARSLLAQPGHEEEGARAYFAGAERLTAAAAERYSQDLSPLLSASEREDWGAAPLRDRAAWLRRFWAERAGRAVVSVAERLGAHYRRLARARREYPRTERLGAPSQGALLVRPADERLLVDDRGLVLIRHGEPDRVVQTTLRGLRPNETWVYFGASGARPTLFHFVALRGANDFQLVTDLLEAIDPTLPLSQRELAEAITRLLEDRGRFEPRYQLAALRLQTASRGEFSLSLGEVRLTLDEISAEYRSAALDAVAGESYAPRFEDDLPFYYDLFTFRGPEGRSELTAAIAIPASELDARRDAGKDIYSLRVKLTVYDSASGAAASVDTLQLYASDRPLGSNDYVRTHVKLPVAPSAHARYRLTIANPQAESSGQSYAGELTVPDYAGSAELLISDIVLAAPDTAGVWTRGAARLALVPPRQFEGAEPFNLFYEVYNLAEDAPYRTEILVEAADRGFGGWLRGLLGLGAETRVRLRFEEHARVDGPFGAVQELRRVQSQLAPGRYRVRISIQDLATGRSASRESEFVVLE